jgi:muramidase (phage lysozyme)
LHSIKCNKAYTILDSLNQYRLRFRALLVTIRVCENNGNSPLAYNKLFGNSVIPLDKHPNKKVKAWGFTDDAAGAYQFKYSTWNRLSKRLNLDSFNELNQDLAASYLITERNKSNIIKYIESNDLENVCLSLNKIWTSLPGGSNQSMNVDRFRIIYKQSLDNESKGITPLCL